MDVLSKEQRTKNMKAIKSKNSQIEILLSKALWRKGYRYRKNDKSIFGTPDISFKKYRLAIFVDSEFFHGKDWQTEKERIQTNHDFWYKKIEGNMERDRIVNETLQKQGWEVLRFWGNDIKKNLYFCIEIIESKIKEIENG